LQHLTTTTRFLHAVRFKNTAGLGKFEIVGTDSQARAAKELYTYLIQSRGSTEPDALLVHAHRLLDAIVRSKTVTEGHIGCITDQVLCLALMRPNNRFGMANVFTGICARNAHGFFDTVAHTAHLKLGGHEHFVPINQEQSDSAAVTPQEEAGGSRSTGGFFSHRFADIFTDLQNARKPGTFMDVVRKTKPAAMGSDTKPTLLG